jgi:hypothetical protein
VGAVLVLEEIVLSLEYLLFFSKVRERLVHHIEAVEMKFVPWLDLVIVNHINDVPVALKQVIFLTY